MACSHCGSTGHNIQRCATVRRCSNCNRHGHDRRNCPNLHSRPTHPSPPAVPPPPAVSPPTSAATPLSPQFAQLRVLCAEHDLLAHLYWARRLHYFEQSLDAYAAGGPWRLVATPHHGVHAPPTPTLNLFVADTAGVDAYAVAAETRDLRHGLLIRKAALEILADRPGYALEPVHIGHPHGHGVQDRKEFWRFDLGNHRRTAVDVLSHAGVVRLATPEAGEARVIDVPHDAVITWW